ncbi:helix-turn-helix domain-containing protein [Catenulispora subtropica]|uniref:Transcriptional regulator, PucR family n=1 Tax=Catenulispora subtropica TaxID=450798 RepID=A0ABN2T436_9ACTN
MTVTPLAPAALPRGFAAGLRTENSSIAAEIIHQIRIQIPEFGRPLSGQFGHGIRMGVEAALADFVDQVTGERAGSPANATVAGGTALGTAIAGAAAAAHGLNGVGPEAGGGVVGGAGGTGSVGAAGGPVDPATATDRIRVYRRLGRGEFSEGRSLDALQAAYRLGARIAWRRYARVGARFHLRQDLMVQLAEAAFAFIDELAAESVRGYAEAIARQAGNEGFRRHRLLQLLVGGAARDTLAAAATAAGWPLPKTVCCVALPGPTVARLPDGVLADLDRTDAYLVIPTPAELLAEPQLKALLDTSGAVVGPEVPIETAADSLRWARAVRGRLTTPASPPTEAVYCDAHLADLLLLADPALVRLIADRRLAPLATLTAKRRHRLEQTLLAWIQSNRSAPDVAARLAIHPQTARQRLHHLQALFGASLTDPAACFELEIALRERAFRTGEGGAAG